MKKVVFYLAYWLVPFFGREGVGKKSFPKWQGKCHFGQLKYFREVSGAGNKTTSYYLTLKEILVLCYHCSIFCDTGNQKIHIWSLNMSWPEHVLVGYTRIFPYCWWFLLLNAYMNAYIHEHICERNENVMPETVIWHQIENASEFSCLQYAMNSISYLFWCVDWQ